MDVNEHSENGKEQAASPMDHKGWGGAPRGNTNRLRHELRASKLAKSDAWVEQRANVIRRALEDALVQQHGAEKITIRAAALVQSALRHEKSSLLAEKFYREKGDELSTADKLAILHLRLVIVERRSGFKLEGIRDEHGHCDWGIALSIVLPLAEERAGQLLHNPHISEPMEEYVYV